MGKSTISMVVSIAMLFYPEGRIQSEDPEKSWISGFKNPFGLNVDSNVDINVFLCKKNNNLISTYTLW